MIATDHDRLTSDAGRAESDMTFVGYALAVHRRRTGLDHAALAAWLRCEPEFLTSLAVCRRPSVAAPTFQADVQRLATVAACDPERLEALLREPGLGSPS